MSARRVWVDFMKTDDDGRVVLTTRGTLDDLATQMIDLRDGLHLEVYSEDSDQDEQPNDLVAEGVVRYDPVKRRWVLEVLRESLRHESRA